MLAATIRKVDLHGGDFEAYCRLRVMLWPMPSEDNRREASQLLASRKWAVFLATGERGELGFAEVSLRDYAEGAASSPVGFLEGWYVVPQARKQSVGRRLVEHAESWAHSMGCTEMASNTEIERTGSIEAHKHLGYEEVERDVCFLKRLA